MSSFEGNLLCARKTRVRSSKAQGSFLLQKPLSADEPDRAIPRVAKLAVDWAAERRSPVAALNATGYGTTLIHDLIPDELGGTADYACSWRHSLQIRNTFWVVER